MIFIIYLLLALTTQSITGLSTKYSSDVEITNIDETKTSIDRLIELDETQFTTTDYKYAKIDALEPAPNRTISSVCQDELIETINYDMTGLHEGYPAGVPKNLMWATRPRIGMGNDPGSWKAMLAWGQLYEDAAGNPATNTRVQIKNIQAYMLSKQDGKWHFLQGSVGVEGAAYHENYADDVNKKADIRYEQDGSISVKAGEGYNFHFWPSDGKKASIDPNDIAGIFTIVQARLIIDDPLQPDDRDEARYLLSMGGDYWANETARWDNWTTNSDIGIGKFKYVTPKWQYFTMNTLSAEQISKNPPPICD